MKKAERILNRLIKLHGVTLGFMIGIEFWIGIGILVGLEVTLDYLKYKNK